MGDGSRQVLCQRRSNGDVISELPKDVLVSILELMPLKDAVKTSALSKKWRYIWVSIKKLIFDLGFFRDIDRDFSAYFEIIHRILLHHNGPLDIFSLYIPYADDSEFSTSGYLFNCLILVSRKGVKSFTIRYSDALELMNEVSNRVLTPLYTCVELTHLKIGRCGFFRPPTFKGFPNLVKLKFKFSNFRGDSFEFLMSSCPLLEHLTLKNCFGPTVFNICSASLRHLEVTSSIHVVIDAENLETLHLCPYGYVYACVDGPLRFASTANFLKKVGLESLDLGVLDEVPMLLSLIHRAPNLQELEILMFRSGNGNKEGVMQILKANLNHQMLDKLKFVKIRLAEISRVEMFLIERLLALSPSLENMVIELRLIRAIDGPKIRGELMGYPRVSPNAQLSLLD